MRYPLGGRKRKMHGWHNHFHKGFNPRMADDSIHAVVNPVIHIALPFAWAIRPAEYFRGSFYCKSAVSTLSLCK
jgi:hypothetical protein